jgi:hypothetical protein
MSARFGLGGGAGTKSPPANLNSLPPRNDSSGGRASLDLPSSGGGSGANGGRKGSMEGSPLRGKIVIGSPTKVVKMEGALQSRPSMSSGPIGPSKLHNHSVYLPSRLVRSTPLFEA